MTAPETPRSNRLGQPCPSWCGTDHEKVLAVTVSGAALYADSHASDALSVMPGQPFVGLGKAPADSVILIRVRMPEPPFTAMRLDTQQAETLADILESAPGQLGIARLIDELRTAAQIARDTHGGAQ